MLDDLRTYLQMASGLTEATTAKAKEVVTGLLSTGMSLSSKAVPAPEVMGQVQELADDLVATSRNNRDMLTAMIRAEVDKAVGRMGFVREDELAALRRHVQRLERQIADLQVAAVIVEVPAEESAGMPVDAPGDADLGAPQEGVLDEADVMADAAAQTAADEDAAAQTAADEAAAAGAPGEGAVEPPPADAPADVVGEAAEPVKKKKKKIVLEPEGS